MTLIPWRNKRDESTVSPTGETPLAVLRSEMDRMFERFFGEAPWSGTLANWAKWGWGPRLDLVESDKDVTVTVELPGVDPKGVDLEVTENTLVIRGEKKQEKEEKKRSYRHVERQFGSFERRVDLPAAIDAGQVEATFKDGVLTVKLGKNEAARPKRIRVRTD